MRLDDDFPTALPQDEVDYTVDLTRFVPTGATVTDVSWALTVRAVLINSVEDTAPSTRLIGDPLVSGMETAQRIGGLVAGNDYTVMIGCVLSEGEMPFLWNVLRCRAA